MHQQLNTSDCRVYGLAFGENPTPLIGIEINSASIDVLSSMARKMNARGTYVGKTDLVRGFGDDDAFASVLNDRCVTLWAPLRRDNCHRVGHYLQQLLELLRAYRQSSECIADHRRQQLMTIATSVTHYAPITGRVCGSFARWIEGAGISGKNLESVQRAIWLTREAIADFPSTTKPGGPHKYPFAEAHVSQDGHLSLETYGASLFTSHHRGADGSRGLESHNSDTVIHQLPLIAGIAKLYSMASAELDKRPP